MPNKDTPELVFLPLGGCGEIGMNLNAYGYGPADDRRWILVDLGVTFGDDTTPGIDLICPDPEFIEEHADQIDAIFLTHAHEDHIGAVGLLWPRLKAPLYATPFTAHLVAGKLAERGLKHVDVNVVPLEGEVETGPFKVRYMTLTHSIPEPNALAITTPSGTVLHTGDWKIDPDPLIGEGVDIEGLTKLGDEGVLAMVCDSTNVFVDGESGSEATVRRNLIKLIDSLKGRVAVATFASNVARVATVVEAARLAGRFYSEGEFDLEMTRSLPGRVMEIGRTCVHPDYRSGAVIALLWSGIAGYINAEGYDYLFGCASIGLEDGGAAAHAILDTIRDKHLAPSYQRVRPYQSLPAADAPATGRVRMPPLLKAYLSLGAKACGEPYWDREFNCADVFMLLNVSDLHPRYARHFLARNKADTAPKRAVLS